MFVSYHQKKIYLQELPDSLQQSVDGKCSDQCISVTSTNAANKIY